MKVTLKLFCRRQWHHSDHSGMLLPPMPILTLTPQPQQISQCLLHHVLKYASVQRDEEGLLKLCMSFLRTHLDRKGHSWFDFPQHWLSLEASTRFFTNSNYKCCISSSSKTALKTTISLFTGKHSSWTSLRQRTRDYIIVGMTRWALWASLHKSILTTDVIHNYHPCSLMVKNTNPSYLIWSHPSMTSRRKSCF